MPRSSTVRIILDREAVVVASQMYRCPIYLHYILLYCFSSANMLIHSGFIEQTLIPQKFSLDLLLFLGPFCNWYISSETNNYLNITK